MSPGWERILPLELLPQLDEDGKKATSEPQTPGNGEVKEPAK